MTLPRFARVPVTKARVTPLAAPLAALLVAALLAASPASAGVLLVRAKGTQIDEAVGALRAELGSAIVAEITVDEATSAAAVVEKANGANVGASAGGVVVAVGARAAQLALQQKNAPVVHCMVLQDAAAFDTPASAGVPLNVPARARLDAMKKLAPAAKRIGVLYDPRVNARAVAELEAAAKVTGHTIVKSTVSSPTDAPAALDALLMGASTRIDGLVLVPDATVVTKQFVAFLVARAFEKRLPVLAFSEALARVGTLAALAPGYKDNGKLCGRLAKRVIAGEKPADLHGAVAMTGTLVVNTATAKKIGVAIAADVLRAPTQLVGE